MQDDDTRASYERLDETRPERNKRSLFEWLTGKEASEEEPLRQQLDKELKTAARKRAEEEEQRRAAESNEEAETKKLKKKWRRKLLEKSRQQLEELDQRGDGPLDGYQLAQYMVAEKIIELHYTLDEEDLRRSEIKALKVQIDFMGLLSEKLSNPELEMPKEVEEVYNTVVSLSEPETAEGADRRKQGQASRQTEEATTPDREEAAIGALYGPVVASILGGLKQAIREERGRQERLRATTDIYGSPESGGGSYDAIPTADSPDVPAAAMVPRLREVIRQLAEPVTALREDLRQARAVERLADAVAKADALRAAGRLNEYGPIAPVLSTAILTGRAETPRTSDETARQHSPTSHTDTHRETGTASAEAIKRLWERQLDELTTSELLTLAGPIELGSGRYLKYAYEHGQIDRSGLIKVLKAYKKGLDYRTEFATRSQSWLRAQEHSPEIAPAPSSHSSTAPSHAAPADKATLEKARTSIPDPPRTISTPHDVINEAKRFGEIVKKTMSQKRTARLLLYASIALTVLLFALVLTLFTV